MLEEGDSGDWKQCYLDELTAHWNLLNYAFPQYIGGLAKHFVMELGKPEYIVEESCSHSTPPLPTRTMLS